VENDQKYAAQRQKEETFDSTMKTMSDPISIVESLILDTQLKEPTNKGK
jgi:hypothetical protein